MYLHLVGVPTRVPMGRLGFPIAECGVDWFRLQLTAAVIRVVAQLANSLVVSGIYTQVALWHAQAGIETGHMVE